jgi:ADP-ribose pyrophosphatase
MSDIRPLMEVWRSDLSHLQETFEERAEIYQGSLLRVVKDSVRLAGELRATREMILHPGAVMVIPLMSDGRVLVEIQHRYPLGETIIEFPAGKVDPGEERFVAAQRELREETGFTAQRWAYAGKAAMAAGYSDERIDMWLASDLRPGNSDLDEGELLELCVADIDELMTLAQQGAITDSKTLAGLWWLARWQSGQWHPEWR